LAIGDSIRNFFNRKRNPELRRLTEWVSAHKGVEGYIEPRTSTNPTTLLLVDRDGDHVRAPVREPGDAVGFCDKHNVPVYDARVIGYPKRMRDFERRRGRSEGDIDSAIADLERRLGEPPKDKPND
jgi:hypothetical protein